MHFHSALAIPEPQSFVDASLGGKNPAGQGEENHDLCCVFFQISS